MTKHTHKYRKVILGGTKQVIRDGKRYLEKQPGTIVFKCMIPGCSHFKLRELMIGTLSICWVCGEELIINSTHLKRKNPIHEYCKIKKPVKDTSSHQDMIQFTLPIIEERGI